MTNENEQVTVRGGVLVNPIPPEDRMAGLDNLKKLPIGPTLPIAGPISSSGSGSDEKNDKEKVS